MSDPREWTGPQRAAVLASLLRELLDTVPTERSSWNNDPEEQASRARRAEELADQMDRVVAKPRLH